MSGNGQSPQRAQSVAWTVLGVVANGPLAVGEVENPTTVSVKITLAIAQTVLRKTFMVLLLSAVGMRDCAGGNG